MTTFDIGRRAEAAAAAYLVRKGFRIIMQNWRTRYCEIDIVACHSATVHFVEVKYRANHNYGSGLDYVTPTKLRQMTFAAEFWAAKHSWQGNYSLSAAAVTGPDFTVTDFIELG